MSRSMVFSIATNMGMQGIALTFANVVQFLEDTPEYQISGVSVCRAAACVMQEVQRELSKDETLMKHLENRSEKIHDRI